MCSKCRVLKELTDFHNCSRSKDGLKSSCKECRNSASVIRRKNEDVKLKDKEYYINNKERIKEYKKEYYNSNKEEILENSKKYYNDNKDYINKRNSIYYVNNKENICKYQREYYIENKEILNEYKKSWFVEKYKTDNIFRLKNSISSLIRNSLKKNGFEKIDYIKICNASDLQEVHSRKSNQKLVVLIAGFLNGVRLIDNMQLI
jgi:hypothetical protein